MKLLFGLIALLFAASVLALFAMDNPGYVLLSRPPWSVEMPLTLFVVLLVGTILLLYLLAQLVTRLWRIPRDVARWRQLRHQRRSQEALGNGLLHLAEGRWIEAEKKLLADLRHNPHPLVNYLAAAFAAHGQGDTEKRNEYLSRAHQHAQGRDLAISMMQAQLNYLAHQHEQALAILSQLHASQPEHPQVLRLLAGVHQELRDWAGLANLIPDLRAQRVMSEQELSALELRTHRELLNPSLPPGSMRVLEKAWNLVPERLRGNPELIAIYARHLLGQGEMKQAERLLTETIARQWDDRLVDLYGRLRPPDPVAVLENAERWLPAHATDPVLLLALGRLASASELKAKAREYLARSIALRELPEAHAELANLLEQSGETDAAREHYRRGLRLATGEEQAPSPRTGRLPRLAHDLKG